MASSILSDRFQKCPPALVQHEHLLGFQCHFSCLSTISYMKKICQTFHAGYQGHPQPLQIRVFQKTPSWVRNWRIHSPQFQSEISHALGFFASLKLAAGCWAGCVFTVGSRAMQSHSQLESAAWEVMPHPKDRELPSTIESPWNLWKQNEHINDSISHASFHHMDTSNIIETPFTHMVFHLFDSLSRNDRIFHPCHPCHIRQKMAPPEDHLWTTSWRRPPYHQYLP